MILKYVVVVSLVFLLGRVEPALAHQPLTTQDAYPVDVHQVRFETGFHYIDYPHGDEAYQLSVEMNYGLVGNLDIGMEVPLVFWRPDKKEDSADIIGDVIVKSKLLFIKGREGNPISLTFQPFLKLPTADEKKYPPPLATGKPDIGFVLIGTRDLRPVMAHVNLGYVLINNPTGQPTGQEYDNVFLFKIALEYLSDPDFELVGELTGETNRDPNEDDLISFLLGTRYRWAQDITLDAGLALGLSNASPNYHPMVGITLKF